MTIDFEDEARFWMDLWIPDGITDDRGRAVRISDLAERFRSIAKRTADNWISVEDRLPEPMLKWCLVYSDRKDTFTALWTGDDWQAWPKTWDEWRGIVPGEITHWQYLLDPPEKP